jgi:multiple sugar transport system substrate-binding protein
MSAKLALIIANTAYTAQRDAGQEAAERVERKADEKAKPAAPGKTGIPIKGQKANRKITLRGIVVLLMIGVFLIGISMGVIYLWMRPWATPPPKQPLVAATTPPPSSEKVDIRWFVGLGTGNDPAQIVVEQALVDEFNATHDNINLILEVVPYNGYDALALLIASGQGPDVIGPVGWAGSNGFYGQWLELSPYMSSWNAGNIDPALIKMFHNEEEGQLGLPFIVFPAATWYMPKLFEEAGLNMPPTEWGGKYTMPDGTEVPWDYTSFTTIARMLTIDANGRNSLDDGFDKNAIIQYGFHPTFSGHPAYLGAFQGTTKFFAGSKGSYTTAIPDSWKAAWKWYYDGIWGDQPFIPNASVSDSAAFGTGATFVSGRIAMTITNLWFICCLTDFAKAGNEFQFAPIPAGDDGLPHGRVDADTFRIWKGTAHPAEAFEVLTFLIGPTGTEYLVTRGIGDKNNPAYGGFPALPEYQQPFLDSKKAAYPFVTTWDVILAGLAYPDVPSAEGYQPNWNDAWARYQTFGDLINTTAGLDLDTEIAALENDLTVIYNK